MINTESPSFIFKKEKKYLNLALIMRKLVIIGFVSLYLFTMLKPAIPYIDYIINFDYISTKLSKNKSKPELQCLGKCHLKKEILKSTEKEKEPTALTFKKIVEDYFFPESNSVLFKPIDKLQKNNFKDLNLNQSNGFLADIFDPPKTLI